MEPMGSPTRPPIPKDVLALPLFSFWMGGYLEDKPK